MPTGPPPRGPWILAAVSGRGRRGDTRRDHRDCDRRRRRGSGGRRRRPGASAAHVTTRPSKADGSASGTEPESNSGSGSGTSTPTVGEGTTTPTSSTGPVISYFTAPTSIVCDPGETVRSVDITVRAERVTELTVSGPGGGSQRLSATANDPTIVGTVAMPAGCATANDFVVTATGTDGSTVERRVTVTGRVRPPAPGS